MRQWIPVAFAMAAAVGVAADASAGAADPAQGPAAAREAPAAPASGVPAAAVTKDPTALRALIGRSIETVDGDEIGTVRDVVVQSPDKADLVVGVGGFLGLGEKQVTIPYDEITMSSETLVVKMTEEQLRRAPEYDPATATGNSIKGGPKR